MRLRIKTADKQDHALELPGAEPTVGELRTEAKRIFASDLMFVHKGVVLGNDFQRLREHCNSDCGIINVVVKKSKPAASPGAAASPATAAFPAVLNAAFLLGSMLGANPSPVAASSSAAVPPAAMPWAPLPAAAAAAAAPGAQPRANTDVSNISGLLGTLTTLTIQTTDKQEFRVELHGAEPTVGKLRTEAKRKLGATDLTVIYKGQVLRDDAKLLKDHGIEDGGTILAKKPNLSSSNGATASPAATAPAAEAPGAPAPAAAPAYPPGRAQAPTDLARGRRPTSSRAGTPERPELPRLRRRRRLRGRRSC
ncbi:hypothetical protein T484DRAFT_1783448 [Baffinella frigidus]|nr:hypothetical protein T484DRAFT_1783448 [Cryptophyta sp. CCMP2293]